MKFDGTKNLLEGAFETDKNDIFALLLKMLWFFVYWRAVMVIF